MSFETYEISVEGGEIVELYKIVLGLSIWWMNTSMDDILYAGDTYKGTPGIKRSKIVSDKETLTVPLPADHAFPRKYATIAPGQTATLTIFQFHRGDTADVKVLYKGVVRAVAFTLGMNGAEMSLIPISHAFKKDIPDKTYQAACNNILYDPRCQVLKASFKYTQNVSVVSGNTITLPGLEAAKGNGWSTAGFVQLGTLDFRLVLKQNADVLSLVLPFHSNVTGVEVDVFAGCDHSIGTCDTKFTNEINFGGTPFVPTKNIFQTGI